MAYGSVYSLFTTFVFNMSCMLEFFHRHNSKKTKMVQLLTHTIKKGKKKLRDISEAPHEKIN